LDVNNLASFLPGGASFNHIAIQAATSNFGTGSAPFNFVAARLKLLLARDQRQNPPTMYL
jgi:hypothetical protein